MGRTGCLGQFVVASYKPFSLQASPLLWGQANNAWQICAGRGGGDDDPPLACGSSSAWYVSCSSILSEFYTTTHILQISFLPVCK